MKGPLHTRSWGDGDRTCLLLHGSMADSRTWWRVAPALVDRGYRVVAVDLPGHGASPANRNATLASHAQAVLDTVPPGPDLAIGHSLGGIVLGTIADRLRPGAAVHLDAPFDWRQTVVPPQEAAGQFARAKRGRTLEALRRDRPSWHERDREVDAAAASLWDVPTAVSLVADLSGKDHARRAVVPSLVLRAEPSSYVSPEEAVRLSGLGYDVVDIPGGAHSLHAGNFDQVMAAVDAWLRAA